MLRALIKQRGLQRWAVVPHLFMRVIVGDTMRAKKIGLWRLTHCPIEKVEYPRPRFFYGRVKARRPSLCNIFYAKTDRFLEKLLKSNARRSGPGIANKWCLTISNRPIKNWTVRLSKDRKFSLGTYFMVYRRVRQVGTIVLCDHLLRGRLGSKTLKKDLFVRITPLKPIVY